MSVSVYILECVVMCAVFGLFVFGMLLVNPVSFIGDYPPEIQAQYYSSQRKEAVKVKMTFLTIFRKSIGIIAFLFVFAWMAHIAGAEAFVDGLLLVYGYMIVLAAFDTCFLDWVLFANIKRVRLPGTEHMDRAYHQKWFHVKVMLPMLPVFAVGGVIISLMMTWIW
ncbi:MAG: hypothetical protein LUD16_01280 [Lachnospiraceae bacterium]|nr:hypothetical protein [Lachnospiraceae bacterium]MCD8398451.1 hypothetical protein [Lachnospiraceae bacterium]